MKETGPVHMQEDIPVVEEIRTIIVATKMSTEDVITGEVKEGTTIEIIKGSQPHLRVLLSTLMHSFKTDMKMKENVVLTSLTDVPILT
jgi:hypothetical protein